MEVYRPLGEAIHYCYIDTLIWRVNGGDMAVWLNLYDLDYDL